MNVHKKIYELVEKELGKKRAILLDDILERFDNKEYWDMDLVEEIDDKKVELKNPLRLPREFAEKWLEALRSDKYLQGREYLFQNEYNNEYNQEGEPLDSCCCLGVACLISGVDEEIIDGKQLITTEYFCDSSLQLIVDNGVPKELVGENILVSILAGLNDGTTIERVLKTLNPNFISLRGIGLKEEIKLSFKEIADFIEDNVEFYEPEDA